MMLLPTKRSLAAQHSLGSDLGDVLVRSQSSPSLLPFFGHF